MKEILASLAWAAGYWSALALLERGNYGSHAGFCRGCKTEAIYQLRRYFKSAGGSKAMKNLVRTEIQSGFQSRMMRSQAEVVALAQSKAQEVAA